MIGSNHLIPSVLILSLLAVSGKAVADEWDDADRATRRLDPAEFRELPAAIIVDLKKRGCTIPQATEIEGRHNVIRGEFAKRGQEDWVVLCSRNRVSSILVFWGGKNSCPPEFALYADKNYLQTLVDGIGYSRAIGSVGKGFIISSFNAFGGPTPPPITHHGIDDAFLGKASGVHYCHNGQWIRLQGAD